MVKYLFIFIAIACAPTQLAHKPEPTHPAIISEYYCPIPETTSIIESQRYKIWLGKEMTYHQEGEVYVYDDYNNKIWLREEHVLADDKSDWMARINNFGVTSTGSHHDRGQARILAEQVALSKAHDLIDGLNNGLKIIGLE
jgi:hypothetical protein